MDTKSEKPLVSFDYAIKYLLKDKGDYEIVEGFISAILKSIGYSDVKIITLFDPESNKEDEFGKRSLADLIVEDAQHHKYVIEIERHIKHTFIPKAYFNTSRLIVDHLAQSVDYNKIIKVFHISLLYFPVGGEHGEVMYHGKTRIEGIEKHTPLIYPVKIAETGDYLDVTDLFAEYFFISVPAFNNRLESEIDEWLYVLKNDNIPPTFHSPYMEKVKNKLNILKMTQAERDNYIAYQKKLCDERDELLAAEAIGLEKGEAIGLEKGEAIGEAKIIKKMVALGQTLEDISKNTGLSISQVQALLSI